MHKNLMILVVDDDEQILFSTLRILKKAGYDTLEAATGTEGLRLARAHRPDIVLLDVVLPDIDGLSVCRSIKDDPELTGSYVMLLSGIKTLSDAQADGLEAGADGYVTRPIPNRELLTRVHVMARLKRAEDGQREYAERLEEMVAERTQKLRDAQERLVRQEKLAVLGQMAGSVGHELRSPLATISNAAYYLNMVLGEPEEQIAEYLDIIRSETRRAEKIIADLLDFSRIKSLNRQEIQVDDVVTLVLEKHEAPPVIQVTTSIPDDLPAIVADPVHVDQVLSNLVLNAYQAMLQGGTLTISARLEGELVAIGVSDTGCGIPPENLEKLFEPLFTTKPKGIGLGLAVCKNLVEANGGTITVESQEQVGIRFTVMFPTEEDVS